MPLQSSGPISLANMNSYFGLGYSFNSYRGYGSVPSSGQISFSQMYGALLREPTSGEYYVNSGGRFSTLVENNLVWGWGYSSEGTDYIRWNGSNVFIGTLGPSTVSAVIGSATYYRGSLRDSRSGTTGGQNPRNYFTGYYGVYRTS